MKPTAIEDSSISWEARSPWELFECCYCAIVHRRRGFRYNAPRM